MRRTGIIVCLILMLLITGCGGKDKADNRNEDVINQTEENTDSTDLISEENMDDGKFISEEGNALDETAQESGQSLEELVAAVQQSSQIIFELAQEPATQFALPDEEMESMKSYFSTETLSPIDYPFYFIPEYKVICDAGVTFFIMKDPTASDFNLYVLQFLGSDTLYSADQFIYDSFPHLLSFTTDESMANMHVFANGDNIQSAIGAAVSSTSIYTAALEYFESRGYALASMMEEDIFRVDDYSVLDMSSVNPNLVAVLVEYRVKTTSDRSDDTWVTGNHFVCPAWCYQNDSEVRAYILGYSPYQDESADKLAEMAEEMYSYSLAAK